MATVKPLVVLLRHVHASSDLNVISWQFDGRISFYEFINLLVYTVAVDSRSSIRFMFSPWPRKSKLPMYACWIVAIIKTRFLCYLKEHFKCEHVTCVFIWYFQITVSLNEYNCFVIKIIIYNIGPIRRWILAESLELSLTQTLSVNSSEIPEHERSLNLNLEPMLGWLQLDGLQLKILSHLGCQPHSLVLQSSQ